jgi:hypothetical protein
MPTQSTLALANTTMSSFSGEKSFLLFDVWKLMLGDYDYFEKE